MQWLIDIIFARVMQNMTGTIILWSGALVDIPTGWQICDGTNGTPDLRDRFIVGAGTTYNPADTGGSATHAHDFIGDGHIHFIPGGKGIASGKEVSTGTDSAQAVGTTNAGSTLPPYYALAYIMRL